MRNTDYRFCDVFETKDYDKFTFVDGNRGINVSHLSRLKRSMRLQYLIRPIIVNEHFQVIEGQHGLVAAKSLDLPIRYIIAPGYGLDEVNIYNSTMKKWGEKEYLESYCALGFEDYLILADFVEEFGFSVSNSARLLSNLKASVEKRHKDDSFGQFRLNAFKYGNFKVGNPKLAADMAKKILQIKPYYSGWNRSKFVRTMMHMFNHEKYDHKIFMGKLKTTPYPIEHVDSITKYKRHVEDIYNYRSRVKVSLIY